MVEAPQSMVSGVCVLLHEDVTSRHDVHHNHLDRHSAGEHELEGKTIDKRNDGHLHVKITLRRH